MLAPTPHRPVVDAQSATNDVVTVERGGFSSPSAIAAVAPDDVWAVGMEGIAHYDGASWRVLTDPPDLSGSEVAVGPDGTGWAVGMGARVAELRGGRAAVATLPWPAEFVHVATTPSGRVWAAGDIVAVRELDGGWRRLPWPEIDKVTALWMHTDVDGWAASGARLLHWDGAAWTAAATPMIRGLIFGIHGTATDDVWAVGGIFGVLGDPSVRTLLHFDGATWTSVVDDGEGGLSAVLMRAPDDGFAVGQRGLLHFDGTAWSFVDAPMNPNSRFGLDALAMDDSRLWIGGAGLIAEQVGTDWERWGGWRTTLIGGDELHLALTPSGLGWAVGRDGPVVRRGADGRWRAEVGPDEAERFQAVAAVSDDECWAAADVGSNKAPANALRFQDGAWTSYDLPTTEPIRSFNILSPTDVWAIAPPHAPYDADPVRRTNVLHFDGARWAVVATLQGGYYAMDVVSSTDAWLVGPDARHFDGSTWRPAMLPGAATGPFSDVDFDASGHGWIVGSGRAFERVDGRWIDRTASLSSLGERTLLSRVRLAPDGSAWGETAESLGGGNIITGTSALVHRVGGEWRAVALGPVDEPFRQSGSDIVVVGAAERYDVWIGTHLETIARVTHVGGTAAEPAVRVVFLPFAASLRR